MYKNKSFRLIGLSLLAANTHSAWADDYADESDYFQEFPLVLTASRLSQPISEAPNAMTVIDRDMIVASGLRLITDLFKLVPGMYVSYYRGSEGFVSYHGSSDQYARRMQVMIDGRSIYSPPASTVNWAMLPITVDDIERIEVIRGPAAASHGANSTQGVISIITRDPGLLSGRNVSIRRGNKGINDVSASFSGGGGNLDYRMSVAYTADNGYDGLTSPPNGISITNPQAATLLNNSNDNNQTRLFNYRADYHPDSSNSYDIQFGYNRNVRGVGFNDKNPSPTNPVSTNGNTFHDLFSDSRFVQAGWRHLQNDGSEMTLRYSHSEQNQNESFAVFLGGAFFGAPLTSQTLQVKQDEIELQLTTTLFESHRLVYGAHYGRDEVNGRGAIPALASSYASSSTRESYRVFVHDEWRISPRLLLNSGALYEYDGVKQENLSPRLSLTFKLTPQHAFRVATSVAYRTPALIEERFRAISPGVLLIPEQRTTSSGLVSERMVSREIGYIGQFDNGATLDVRLFNENLSNGLFPNKIVGAFTNGFTSRYWGAESTLKYAFNQDSEMIFNFARARGSSNGPELLATGVTFFGSASPWTGDVFEASVPRNSGSVQYSQRLPKDVSFSATYYQQGALQPFDRGLIDYQPIQRRADVRIAKGFNQVAGFNGDVALVVQNLFNQGYTEYIANNLFNQRAFVTLNLNW